MTVSGIQVEAGDFGVFPFKLDDSIFEPEGIVAEIFERVRSGSRSLRIGERDLVSTDADVYSRGQAATLSGEVPGELSQVTLERAASVGRVP